MQETNKNKEEIQLEEVKHEQNSPAASGKPIVGILSGIILIIMFGSIIWTAHILCNGGPHGFQEIIITVIGCLSTIFMVFTFI